MKLKLTVEQGRFYGVGTIDGYLYSRDYAEKNGIKECNVRRYIYLGKLDAIKVGNSWWIKEDAPVPPELNRMKTEELVEYLEERADKLDPNYFKSLNMLKKRKGRNYTC